jgi:hypothetical protein
MGSFRAKRRAGLSAKDDSLAEYVNVLIRHAPELLDLFTADTDAEFDAAFDALLERAVAKLEQSSKDFKDLSEDGLSSAFAMALSMPGLTVSREMHSNGHVDITIEAQHCVPLRRKLAEAKIYDGPEKHIAGLEQLLTRYSTGREGRGLLIVYFQKQNIEGLVKKIRAKMDADQPLHQVGATADHTLQWSFLSTHSHHCGKNLEVAHVGCNLFVPAVKVPPTETV